MMMLCTSLSPSLTSAKQRQIPLERPVPLIEIPSHHASAACLIDVASKRVLYAFHANDKRRIASLTKIVTAYVATKTHRLHDVFLVSRVAARQEGSSIYLKQGEKVRLQDLLYGMMLRSGNDAAMTIAQGLAGSQEQFAMRMNQAMAALHLTHSHFVNPHGLDHANHYSSAYDMARVAAEALGNPFFRQLVRGKKHSIPRGLSYEGVWINKNKMLWMMPEADGIKTGYTRLSGRCLASSATLSGRQVALVVLNDPTDWIDSKRLLTYGLTAYHTIALRQLVTIPQILPVLDGVHSYVTIHYKNDQGYPLTQREMQKVKTYVHIRSFLRAPVQKGMHVGYVEAVLEGKRILYQPLETNAMVLRKSAWQRFMDRFSK